jgi:hypothetical protein
MRGIRSGVRMRRSRAFPAGVVLVCLLLFCMGAGCVAQGEGGYYAGRSSDGRTLLFGLSSRGDKTQIGVHVEGVGSAVLILKTNTAEGIGFSGGSDDARWPIAGLWLARSTLPEAVTGLAYLSQQPRPLRFAAARIAARAEYSGQRGLHLLKRGGSKRFGVSWPDFTDGVPFHQAISKLLAAEARGETRQFLAGAYGLVWAGFRTGRPLFDWEGLVETEIIWPGTNLVSLYQVRYEFTGGAHGNTQPLGRNFVFAGGNAREFGLTNLFLAGSGWLPVLAQACLRELRRQGAAWVMPEAPPGTRVKGFEAAELGSFNVDGKSLILHFAPYAVGPYAQGVFEVVIPWRELQPFLDPNGPTRFLR